jgi:hypothetical protein
MRCVCWLALCAVSLPLSAQPRIGGCPVFPAKNIWNVPIDKMPVHAASAAYIATEGPDVPLHPDFGPSSAIPFAVVPANQPMVPIHLDADESDPGPYPIPPDPPLEKSEDAHLLIVRQGECKLYEVYAAKKMPDGTWRGGSGAVYDLRLNALRPDGWTSADAAGLPILPGLVRYDEAASGTIRHAIRLTVPKTGRSYVWPARHFASRLSGNQYPPMGMRFRLKAGYDISRFHPIVRTILQALKTYGMILADNGAAWYITGAPDPRWSDEILAQLKQVKGSDLEAVDVTSLQGGPNSALALDPNASGRALVAFSKTPVFDLGAASTQSITLSGDVVSSTIANAADGGTFSFLICQDQAGGHAFHWPANVLGGMQVSTKPHACSAQSFVSDGAKLYATTPGMAN